MNEPPATNDAEETSRPFQFTLRQLLVAMFIFTVALVVLIPFARSGNTPGRRLTCTSRLRELGLALLVYHQKQGSLPPAFTTDESGQPKHSWRAKMLPYLDHQTLYEEYDFSEPWNGFHNGSLGPPHCYRCPSDQ